MYDTKAQQLVFIGYRKGKKGKKPLDNKLYSYDDVKELDNFGAQCREDVIDISFDAPELFETILDICDEQKIYPYAVYSPHGGHTYWRIPVEIKNGRDIITTCGVKADYHNKGTYIPLMVDGEYREEVYMNIT